MLVMPPAGREGLTAALGPDSAQAVGELLLDRALGWAASASAAEPLRAELGETLAAAAQRAFAACGDAPLLIAWPDLPVWRDAHRTGPLSDLAEGCGVTVGPVFDGGFYLMALAAPIPGLLELAAGADAMNQALLAAHAAGLDVGLLRPERGLRGEADIAAALADPLLDGELRGVLS